MNEQQLQLAFIQFLAQKTGAKNQLELEAAIQLMGEEGLKLAYAEFMQMMQLQLVQAAKFGAKLNYIKSLRGQCPEGYEISYYKVGGTICKKCMKKQLEMKDGGYIPKDPIDEFKCGRKMKKKKAQGGAIDFDKCGGKTKKPKKKENGGELNSTKNPKAFSKMALAKCGAKLRETCKGIKMNQQGNKLKKKPDLATRDSIAANKYNDLEVQTLRPGSYKKNKDGKVQWTPDRTKSPYNKKKVDKKLQGGWINKDRGIWNYDSWDRYNKIKNYYNTGNADQETLNYLNSNLDLKSYLDNVYSNNKNYQNWVANRVRLTVKFTPSFPTTSDILNLYSPDTSSNSTPIGNFSSYEEARKAITGNRY